MMMIIRYTFRRSVNNHKKMLWKKTPNYNPRLPNFVCKSSQAQNESLKQRHRHNSLTAIKMRKNPSWTFRMTCVTVVASLIIIPKTEWAQYWLVLHTSTAIIASCCSIMHSSFLRGGERSHRTNLTGLKWPRCLSRTSSCNLCQRHNIWGKISHKCCWDLENLNNMLKNLEIA